MILFSTPMLAIMAAVVAVSMITINIQQVLAIQDSEKIAFKKLTHEFEKNVINAIGDPDISPGPRELLSAYVEDVNRIFLGCPNTIPRLLEQYELAVLAVFVAPPDPERQQQHDQVKEFRQLTHGFEKAVLALTIQPCI